MNNAELNARIDELWAQTKRGELPRADRFKEIEALIDEYIATTGKRPDTAALDRLATLCLYEEVTDSHPDKMSNENDAVMSNRQYDRRKKSEWWREEIHVGEAHIIGKKVSTYKNDDDVLQNVKTTYYLR